MTIPPTPMMMDLVVKIVAELFLVLASATKQNKQGRFSKCFLRYTVRYICSMSRREIYEDVVGKK